MIASILQLSSSLQFQIHYNIRQSHSVYCQKMVKSFSAWLWVSCWLTTYFPSLISHLQENKESSEPKKAHSLPLLQINSSSQCFSSTRSGNESCREIISFTPMRRDFTFTVTFSLTRHYGHFYWCEIIRVGIEGVWVENYN